MTLNCLCRRPEWGLRRLCSDIMTGQFHSSCFLQHSLFPSSSFSFSFSIRLGAGKSGLSSLHLSAKTLILIFSLVWLLGTFLLTAVHWSNGNTVMQDSQVPQLSWKSTKRRSENESESGQRNELSAVSIKASWVCRAGRRLLSALWYNTHSLTMVVVVGEATGALAPTHNSTFAVSLENLKRICFNIGWC